MCLQLERDAVMHRLLLGFLGIVLGLNIYIYNYPTFHGCAFEPDAAIRLLAFGDPQITGTPAAASWRKQLDVYGNDRFLAHVVRTLRAKLHPQFVCAMGDLISSQWIDDDEFHERADRFAAIFPPQWPEKATIYNLSGNHDVGYHGEMTTERVDRFEERYGSVNFVQEFTEPHPYRIVALNSLSLDGPSSQYQEATFEFLNALKDYPHQTILLIHVPLYKPDGLCKDSSYFQFYPWGAIKEQNHLSYDASQLVLSSVFASEADPESTPNGIVLTGHDHEGCLSTFTKHNGQWDASAGLGPGIKEATVRSVMGEYGGNGGLLSGTWNATANEYDFAYQLCRFQVQHLWWATKGATIVALALLAFTGFAAIISP